MTNPYKTVEKIEVYWENDPIKHRGRWICNNSCGPWPLFPLSIEGTPDLARAIEEACRSLVIDLTPDDFDILPGHAGGYAIWRRPVEEKKGGD